MGAGRGRIRLDTGKKFIRELARLTRRAPVPLPPQLASRLGVRREMLPAVLKGLNMRVHHPRPMPADRYGPPAPIMIRFHAEGENTKAEKPRPAQGRPASRRLAARRPDSPFAALATLLDRP
ncbi:hypothetical protein KUA08_14885 [Komagataeibacter melomenusus]|uniref:hypothetical protein n=1 Tax=Komagataeibacter melomenusus TaxID=2766578 RepID=UPI001C2D3DA5|nr:hypothetical protein [Komagataeibacter melomenusus]MBV1831875.1 hypothetical protein [Komagataeibacter melomenusus]